MEVIGESVRSGLTSGQFGFFVGYARYSRQKDAIIIC